MRILFSQRIGIINSIVLFVAFSAAAYWLTRLDIDAGNENARVLGLLILGITGIATPLYIITYGITQSRKGDLLRYDINNNVLEIPHISTSIENARQRVYFSSEYFKDYGRHLYELNIVVDGQRIKFISSSVSNGFRDIVKPLESLGFSVNHQKFK